MKRINFQPNRTPVIAARHASPVRAVVLLVTISLVLALFASAASAGEFAACDKVKHGTSGQCYAWKKDC